MIFLLISRLVFIVVLGVCVYLIARDMEKDGYC